MVYTLSIASGAIGTLIISLTPVLNDSFPGPDPALHQSSGNGGATTTTTKTTFAMRWCAAVDVANLIRLSPYPHLLLHLEVLVCGILVAVDLHIRHMTFLGGHWHGHRLKGRRENNITIVSIG